VIRTALGALVGWLVGVGLTVLLLWATDRVIRQMTAPRVFEIEYRTIYLALVLGAGFGALSGAVAGLAGVVQRRLERPPSPAVPPEPVTRS
jgi:NhaP-type Na+/H+ or K+/H+ antiporter